ncbi:MAG: hypothetical protein ACRYGI_03590 [Janthinobacterium lividum]
MPDRNTLRDGLWLPACPVGSLLRSMRRGCPSLAGVGWVMAGIGAHKSRRLGSGRRVVGMCAGHWWNEENKKRRAPKQAK